MTGRVGFVGGHLPDRLIENNFEVKVIDDLSSGRMENLHRALKEKRVLFTKGDIRDNETVKNAVRSIS